MTEEVKVRSFSEMANAHKWERPESMLVIKRSNISWNQYWSEKTQKFGPLLEATIYTDSVPTIEGGEAVSYRDVLAGK